MLIPTLLTSGRVALSLCFAWPFSPPDALAGATEFDRVDVLIANPLRLKGLEEEGKVDLSKVRRGGGLFCSFVAAV